MLLNTYFVDLAYFFTSSSSYPFRVNSCLFCDSPYSKGPHSPPSNEDSESTMQFQITALHWVPPLGGVLSKCNKRGPNLATILCLFSLRKLF